MVELSKDGLQFMRLLGGDKSKINQLSEMSGWYEKRNRQELVKILDWVVLNRNRIEPTLEVDKYCISIYERIGFYQEALKIAVEVLKIKRDLVVIRSIFRICRKMGDYDIAEKMLLEYPEIHKSDSFHVLYELVYFFEEKDELDKVKEILSKIEKFFPGNLPINKTLKNFYLKFGMVKDSERIEERIFQIQKNNKKKSAKRLIDDKYSNEVLESQEELTSKMKDLYSELEHQKQLAAISELTTGISHELGQPITNIRYTIQFFLGQFNKEIDKDLSEVFGSILEETQRMWGLVKRLSPLTSSKNVDELFDIVGLIRKRVRNEGSILRQSQIRVEIFPKREVYVFGDRVKFEQIISNLLLNAIYAIEQKGEQASNRVIKIKASNEKDNVGVVFEDTGIGVTVEDRKKIFDPFFSTKPTGVGEGLGLYIVWSLVKSYGGEISLDPSYNNGARFIILIPKRWEKNEK